LFEGVKIETLADFAVTFSSNRPLKSVRIYLAHPVDVRSGRKKERKKETNKETKIERKKETKIERKKEKNAIFFSFRHRN
jgi:hypothetical protein